MPYQILQAKIDTHLVRGDSVRYWNGIWNKDRFIIVDDKQASDDVLKQTWRIVTPIDTKLSVLTLEKAIQFLSDVEHYGNEKIVIFTNNVNNVARLVEAGISLNCPINVCSLEANGPKAVRVGRIGLSQKDVEDIEMMHAKGLQIITQEFPEPLQQQEDFYQKMIEASANKEEK